MKKSFFLAAISWTVFFSWPSIHATTVNPTPGDSTWTLVSRLGQVSDETTPILIFNSDQSEGVITLSTAGNYLVAEDLIYPIVISTNKACLDLNCKKISSSDGSVNLITVNSGLNTIAIHNGRLINTDSPTGAGAGILIQSGSSRINVERMQAVGCGNGIKLNGQDSNEIIECELVALDLVSNTTGLVLNHADENTIKDCCALHNTQAGFELLDSEANCFYNCQALKTFGAQTAMGFTSRAGQSNLFQRCVSKKTKTSAWEFCNKAYGFLLTSTEEKTKLIECIVNETDVTSTVSAIAYGIHLAPILLDIDDLLAPVTDISIAGLPTSIAWSSDGKYIITGDLGGYVRVFSFNGGSLHLIDSYNTPGAVDVNSVSWSPDGKYIISGDNGGSVRVFSFDGSILTHLTNYSTPGAVDVNSVAWSLDGKYITSGDDGGSVRVFSFNGSTLTHIDDNTPAVSPATAVSWSPNGKYITSGHLNSFVYVFSFDGSTLTLINGDDTSSSSVRTIAWSPNGKYIAGGGNDQKLHVYSFDGSNVIHIADDPTPTDWVLGVAWSPNGKYITSSDDIVRIFGFDGATLTYIDGVDTPGSLVRPVAWSPDGNYIAIGDNANSIRVFDAMYGPQNCLIDSCVVCDTSAFGQFVGTGIAGGGNNSFVSNVCCNNEVNYTYGIPNVFYGGHNIERNTVQPFDNISMPTTQ